LRVNLSNFPCRLEPARLQSKQTTRCAREQGIHVQRNIGKLDS